MISGVFGTVVDPDTVFRWSLYLLLALWPLAVYWSGRLFGLEPLDRRRGGGGRAVPRLGRRHRLRDKAYVWVGYGVWTQLWASWTLPLAWGFTYRALSSLRRRAARRLLHHADGRPALRDRATWPSCRSWSGRSSSPPTCGAGSGAPLALGGAALLASAWVIVPLLAQSHWAARNQVLEGTGLENGYGARQILSLALHRPALRRRALARRHDLRRRRHRGLHLALAHVRGRPGPGDHLGGHARS